MSDIITIGRDRPEEEILTHEVSDEALETVASTGSKQAGNYTIAFCTWVALCPV